MRETITAAAACTVLAAATALLTPAPAQATAVTAATAAPSAARSGACATGQLCLWRGAGFSGARTTHELSDTDIESCVPLPGGATAASLANRTGRPVTTYQSAECGETGEFDTYPSGSWAPESPYQVRAFKIWES
ncbi:peptidase inhibitor family I36 protein [Streptomyces sp. XD-27]|uniref:peptidase inhibitor family I36 protein n=1 Tax=Streptomyces sp. XD-27 TaxID=3062779 RepID=UPI0026F41708|nr:peptidase inhibitor family I36 protein [Streptomyces sp. XD-27]WKX70142.1 peptidase inhibitor family I36 protein [Streptomyces sp. XD-27]